MTGHGEAQCIENGLAVSVEVRAVNNRFFKHSFRISEGFAALESGIEKIVRQHIRRGSVQTNVRVDRQPTADDYRLNEVVLASYRKQLESLCAKGGYGDSIHLESLLALPGVVNESNAITGDVETVWPVVEKTVKAAVESLAKMRTDEGATMAENLTENCRQIAVELAAIEARAPLVVDAYQKRLTDRLNQLLETHDLKIEAADVVREVGIYAERSDIAEEIVRLRSHLAQFDSIAGEKESNGRKLEFVIQEMLRETNTIGSKANDADIARHVVEIKTLIERMREMIQNVE